MMSDPNPARDERRFALRQAGLLVMVLLFFGIAEAVAQWCVHNEQILLPSRTAEWKRTRGVYSNCGFYDSAEDRFLNEVLPDADYSRGGVYLLGASGMQTAVALWERPELEQRFIHNYAFSGITFTQEFQFVRYLVEERGLLRSGGDRTSIIIGAAFTDASHLTTTDPSRFSLRRVLTGHRTLYNYDLEHGMRLDVMPAWMRWFRREQIRNQAFWSWASKVLLTGGDDLHYLRPVTHQSPVMNREFWLNWMDGDWENGLDTEFDQLSRMIDYLHARKVNVYAVYLPTESWAKGFPPVDRYRRKALDLFSSKSVPLTDLADTVADDDFGDSVHLGYAGVQKTAPTILAVAQCVMQRSGIVQ